MKIKKASWLFIALALVMVVSMFAGFTGAEVEENFAFIPNASEATVSKVDLLTMQEVAKYYTVDPSLNSNDYNDINYRVARLVIDSGGNAWALNTMTGQGQSVHEGLGSVARIAADLPGGEDPTVFPLGDFGDCPRTISIVEENGTTYLWIGFWNGQYFQKYEYVPDSDTLELVVGENIDVSPATPYYAALDDNGIMWISSRHSSPFPNVNGTMGVFNFDTNDLGTGVTTLNYAPPGNQANPYSILVASDGRVWVSNGGNWNTSEDRQFAVYTYGVLDPVYCSVGVATEAMRGFIEYDGHIWATAISGEVLKGTFANGGCPTWEVVKTYPRVTAGGGLTGIGPDAAGNLWVVHFDDNVLYGFDPTTGDDLGPIGVGAGPYAYDNFIVPAEPVFYDLCGYKYLAVWDGEEFECEEGLEGWEISLKVYDEGENDWVLFEQDGLVNPVNTDEDGKYCFTDLPAGTYRIYEGVNDGYQQISPDDYHEVTLPGDETDLDAEYPTYWNFCNEKKNCETAWATQVVEGEAISNENWDQPGTGNAWGWNIGALEADDTVYFELWAAAGQNILANGVQVGEGRIEYDGEQVCVYFTLYEGFDFEDVHLWVGETNLPIRRGDYTAAPGQFNYNDVEWDFDEETGEYSYCVEAEGAIFVALHLEVCWFPSDLNGNNGELE